MKLLLNSNNEADIASSNLSVGMAGPDS